MRAKGFCKLEETDKFDLSDCLAAKVELEEPIHQILNLPEFDERAVSLHIYSKPFDKCLSYCCETDTFKEINLSYASIGGKICDGIELKFNVFPPVLRCAFSPDRSCGSRNARYFRRSAF